MSDRRRGMSRRAFLPVSMGAAGLAGGLFGQEPAERWNVVMITGDHLRWDHVAANGNPHILTPAMDRLAARGVSFTKFHTVGVACSPNRASLFTGRYPQAHGVRTNGIELPETEVTLTHVLRGNGWYTGQMGKLHFWPHAVRNHRDYHPPYGFHQMRLSDEPGCYDDAYGLWLDAQGPEVRRNARVTMPGQRARFEYYTFEGDEKTTWVADETIRFIEDNRGRPFFVHAGFYAPHPPLNPPASMLALYKDRDLPPRIYQEDEAKYAPPGLARALGALKDTPESVWTEYRKHFYAMVSDLDRNIGRIVEAVEKQGLLDRTLFVITSDHGDYLGDHHLVSKSALPYDGAMRIPLIFAGPGVPKGRKVDALTEVPDVMPTILELMGVKAPRGVQGRSLRKVFEGGEHRKALYMLGPNTRTLTTAAARYCLWENGEEALFDLKEDPHQLRNLSLDEAGRPLLAMMRKQLLLKEMELLDPLPPKVAPY